jgi:hypothetical protein
MIGRLRLVGMVVVEDDGKVLDTMVDGRRVGFDAMLNEWVSVFTAPWDGHVYMFIVRLKPGERLLQLMDRCNQIPIYLNKIC